MVRLLKADANIHSILIADLIRQAFAEQAAYLKLDPQQYPNFVGFETPERTFWRLTHGDIAYLAQLDDTVIGTISHQAVTDQPRTGYIKRLAVLPSYRGRDYGLSMMKHAETQLRMEGNNRTEISIVAEFSKLHQYYRHQGYKDGDLTRVPVLPFMVQYLFKELDQEV